MKTASLGASSGGLPLLYRGSVKDLLGPTHFPEQPGNEKAIVFDYTDAYSVFDWGRMPDLLPGKGQALAALAAFFFEKLGDAAQWARFLAAPAAATLSKANPFGARFAEIGAALGKAGLKTHYLGISLEDGQLSGFQSVPDPFRRIAVSQVAIARPVSARVLGREILDYSPTRLAPAPKLIPLEVVFRFSLPEGSSFRERARDPGFLERLGYGAIDLNARSWDFPVLELFTKLESTDRWVGWAEALAISGLSGAQLEEVFLKTAWVAGFLKAHCARSGIELADGKLEWALDSEGQIILVDAIGPDELRMLKGGVQLSKEFLRVHYRKTPWFNSVKAAKEAALARGSSDWKSFVKDAPPALPQRKKELAASLYGALALALTGREIFPSPPLDDLVKSLGREADL